MTCAACKDRAAIMGPRMKETFDSEPRCAFPDNGSFNPDNWNCATANQLRDICSDCPGEHPAVDWRAWNNANDNGDQKYATIELPEIDELDRDEARALALWLTWYKRRGRTDEVWLLMDEGAPRRPTEAECLMIVEALSRQMAVTQT